MIDVLRASTTICHALSAGANAVVPCETVEQAREIAAGAEGEETVLGGERRGQLIDGFDLDNSPLNYTEEAVRGKTVIFTTTNGTRALSRCVEAGRILIASFNNAAAVVDDLLEQPGDVHIVCAGTDGRISREDILLAGGLALSWMQSLDDNNQEDDATNIAVEFYQVCGDRESQNTIANSRGGRNLQRLGMMKDIERAAEVNRFDFVPVYSPKTGRITKA